MQVVTGTVVEGRIVVDGLSLPAGTLATGLSRDDEPTAHPPPRLEAELLQALDGADREEGISGEELLAQLSPHG